MFWDLVTSAPQKMGHAPHKNHEMAWHNFSNSTKWWEKRMHCVQLLWGSLRLALLLTKQWKSHVWKLFFFKSKKNMLEKTILMFHVFFFKYILMKDIWFNILQIYTKQVRVDTIFKSLLRVTRNLLERTQTSRHLYISLVK